MQNTVEIRVEGKAFNVSCAEIDGQQTIVTGTRLRTASIMDEEFVVGESVKDPDSFIKGIKNASLRVDLFTFCQPLTDVKPKHQYHLEWDNAAVIPITTFQKWLDGLSQETRRNIRKASKAGVTVKTAQFDDAFSRGIVEIYNETPVRQGRRFWHYGKSFETVKLETATYLDRSEFIGAYLGDELIGFIKMIYVARGAHIVYILSKVCHADKRPTNALIAKAVELCAEKGLAHFVYCKYVYGKTDESPLTEFKRRNGFERVDFPRYYIPLSITGKTALKLGIHHGWSNLIPKPIFVALVGLRRRVFSLIGSKSSVEKNAS